MGWNLVPRGSSRLTHSFASEHIKHWIKAVLQDSWQLQGGSVRTAKTLFKQILARVYFKCSTKPVSKRIFQYATGVHPTVGNGTARTDSAVLANSHQEDALRNTSLRLVQKDDKLERSLLRKRRTEVKRVTARLRRFLKDEGYSRASALPNPFPPDCTSSLSPCLSLSVPFPGRSQLPFSEGLAELRTHLPQQLPRPTPAGEHGAVPPPPPPKIRALLFGTGSTSFSTLPIAHIGPVFVL